MKLKSFLAVSLGFCFALPVVHSQMDCSVANDVFLPGERLEYQLFYNVSFVWLQAGTCQFNTRSITYNGRPAYKLSVDGRTFKSFDPFYRVRDTLVSYIDPEHMYPIRAYKYTHEDSWHGIDDFSFRKGVNEWRVTTRLMRKKVWQLAQTTNSSKCGFDILTSIYRLRCMADPEFFIPKKRIEIPVRMDDGEYSVYLTYIGKVRIKLHNIGQYNAHEFHITMVEGNVFKRGDVLKLWISDDKNRIPLLVESPIKVGYVKAILKSAESTRFPLQKPIVE
jgi:hypothetical protein